MNWLRSILGVFAALLVSCAASAQTVPNNVGPAAQGLPPILQNVGFEPALNAQLPLDLPFRDETGRTVQLHDFFAQRPVLLALVYYSCPMLCDELQEGVVGSLRMLSFTPGRDYQVVFVSFDPRDTPATAEQKKVLAMKQFHRPETGDGWHFLTGSPESIDALTKGANFRYTFDKKSGLFAHASGILLLTPDGRISRYFYGVEYPSREIRLGLVDASAGKIGTPIDHILLYCYQYDPSTARYSTSILKVLRLGGVLTIVCMVGGILIFRRRDVGAQLKRMRGAH
jgi:protein SCO1